MSTFSFDRMGFQVDGQDAYLVSGEFHYFRVPRPYWADRLKKLKECGFKSFRGNEL